MASSLGREEEVFVRNKLHRPFTVCRDGGRVVGYRHGSGRPIILFVGAISYGLAPFHPLLERLCQEFEVVTVDVRGIGRSDPLRRPYGIEQHALDLGLVLEALKGAPVVGVGISRGSNLLVRAYHRHTDALSALVFVGMPPSGPVHSGAGIQDDAYQSRIREALQRGDIETLVEALIGRIYSESDRSELRRLAIERCRRIPRETMLSFFDPDQGADVRSLLASIRVPVLVAHGYEDRHVPFGVAEATTRAIPGAELHGFRGKGHLPMFTAPDEFCSVLCAFIRGRVPN